MTLKRFLSQNDTVVRVCLTQVRGSSTRDAGAQMFVSPEGLFGTIGGGQLEYMAIDKARAMLRAGRVLEDMDVPLGPEIGQCCGGRVGVALRYMHDRERAAACRDAARADAAQPSIFLFGAGHVGRALANLFQHMPVHCTLVDSRPDELGLCEANVQTRLSAMAEAEIRRAPKGSAFVILTHDHALDFLLTSEALGRSDAAYVGLIGSATKRVKFERFHAAQSSRNSTSHLICPIGHADSRDKRPEVIAISVAAQVMASLTTPAKQKAPSLRV